MFEDLDFPVALEDFKTMDDKVVEGRKLVRRTDSGEVLNVVSNKYQLVPHIDVFQKTQEAVNQLGVKVLHTAVQVGSRGSYARVIWTLDQEMIVENGNAADKVKARIVARNSYNYSALLGLGVGVLRQICTNGAMGWGPVNQKRHVPSLSVPMLMQMMMTQLSGMEKMHKDMNRWNKIDVSPEGFSKWLAKRPDVISKKARQEIIDYYTIQPDRLKVGESVHHSGWEAYNALTWFATHRVKTRSLDRALIAEEMILQVANQFAQKELSN